MQAQAPQPEQYTYTIVESHAASPTSRKNPVWRMQDCAKFELFSDHVEPSQTLSLISPRWNGQRDGSCTPVTASPETM